MREYTFTDNGFTFERVSKRTAEKAYNNGLTVIFCPVNMRPFGIFACGCDITKREDEPFQTVLNRFEFYNCTDNETGHYTAFYIPVKYNNFDNLKEYDYSYLQPSY